MRSTPRWAVALPLAIILFSLLPASAQAAPVTLTAERDEAGDVRATLTASAPFSGRLLVTHEDPLAGMVVDRMVPIAMESGERLVLTLPGMRAGVDLLVRVIPATEGPDRLPFADLYDGETARSLTTLAQATVPASTEASRELQVPVHGVAQFDPDGGFADYRVRALSTGALVAGYTHGPTGTLAMRTSRDGGHTWGMEHVLAREDGAGWSWGFGETSAGVVRVYVHRGDAGAGIASQPWRIFDLDTKLARLEPRQDAPNVLDTGYWAGRDGLVVMPDGSALLAQANGDLRVWRLAPGSMAARATIPWSMDAHARQLAVDDARVALVFAGGDGRLYVTRSADSGQTFAAPAEMRSTTRVAGQTPSLSHPQIASDGALHLIVANSTGVQHHVRAPLGAADTTTPIPSQGTARLAVKGQRVTLTAWEGGQQRLLESVDAGVTFAIGPALSVWWGHTTDLGLLPDGRPAMLGRTLTTNDITPHRNGVGAALPFDPEPAEPARVESREGAGLSLRDLLVESGRGSVTVQNSGSVATQAQLDILVDGVVTERRTAHVEARSEAVVTFPLPALQEGSTVIVRLSNGVAISTTTRAPASPAPTSPTARPTTDAPPPPQDEVLVELSLAPATLTLTPGGGATVIVVVTNRGPSLRGSETPTIQGLPPGVNATFDESGWVELPAGTSKQYTLWLSASAEAPLGGAVAVVSARHAVDRPTLHTALEVAVGPQAAFGGISIARSQSGGAWFAASAAGGVGLVLLFARSDAGRIVAGATLLPLYARLSKGDVLRHDVRNGVFEQVKAEPGTRFEQLRRALDVPAGVLSFHLRVLEREGYVRVSREWTRRRYYPEGIAPPASVSTTEQAIEALLSRDPGMSASAVAHALGISRQLARYHLKRLERQGWLRAEGDGGLVGYKLVR